MDFHEIPQENVCITGDNVIGLRNQTVLALRCRSALKVMDFLDPCRRFVGFGAGKVLPWRNKKAATNLARRQPRRVAKCIDSWRLYVRSNSLWVLLGK
jgi:hypothetical protein